MKKLKRVLPFICLAITLAVCAAAQMTIKADENSNVIPANIYIGTIDVGGMTVDEATEAVNQYVADNANSEFELRAAENSVTASSQELGLEWGNTDVVEEALSYSRTGNLLDRYKAKKNLENEDKVFDLKYTVAEDTVRSFLEKHADVLDQEAVNNGLTREDGAFQIIDGQEGIAVDEDASVTALQEFFASNWDGKDASIDLVANVVEPEGTAEELEKVQDVLGSFSTDFSDSAAGRVANVKNAVAKINGMVIYPDEEFSVYETIAPLDAANGYELAGSYENGTTVESYGGGVCQVSTTLYNAVIRAELDITERYAHSMLVSYVHPSMDAAIAGELKDLKFKNSTDAPIYIEGYCSGGIVYFNVFGEETRPANREVDFVSETVSEEEPTIQIEASAEPIGTVTVTQKAHIGKTAKLWKIVKIDGVEQSREEFNTSKYKASPRIVTVGTASDNAEAVGAINAAIATQDEAAVNAAAATWCTDAIAARAAQQAADAAAAANAAQNAGVDPGATDTTTPPATGTTPPSETGTTQTPTT